MKNETGKATQTMGQDDTDRSFTDMVRSFASASGLVRKKQVADALGLVKRQADSAFRTLQVQGFLKRVGRGTYEYVERPMAGVSSPINDRVWRGMQINPKFSCSELARISGTTTNYVYKLMRRYRAEGLVEPYGRHTALSGFHEKLWRLTQKGKRHRERPLLTMFEPDPLVVKVVTLNRLVCTGMAMRITEERGRALKLCKEIMEGLSVAGHVEGGNDEIK